jgi:xylulokinase
VSTVLACDIGGSSMRAALVDAAGDFGPFAHRAAPRERVTGGRCEIDPERWWDIFRELVEALAAHGGRAFDTVEAVAICGVTRTQVILDRSGRALYPAMTWRDTRAAAEVAQLVERLPNYPERAHVDVFHPLARLVWLGMHEERVLAEAAAVVEPKDYINFRLTGRIATDPISSARLIAAGEAMLSAAGLPAYLVPDRIEPTDRVGSISPAQGGALARLAGRPVFCLSHDTWAAALGLGALRLGFAYSLSGTTEVLGVISGKPIAAPGLLAVPWGQGLHHLGGPSQSGADTLAWLCELFPAGAENTLGEAIARLLASPRDPQPALFLPYLRGERAPHWDAALRGGWLGLNRRHTQADLGWAVLEGIAFLNRLVLERAEHALGHAVHELRFGGGGAGNPLWCQIKADICERPIAVGASSEPGLLGCAIAARVGLGAYASLAAAQQALVRIARVYRPRNEHREIYRQLYALYRECDAALAPLSRRLAALETSVQRLPGVAAAKPTQTVPQ